MALLGRKDLLYPELSYKIVGSAFSVFNDLGPGLQEKTYENALAVEFDKQGLRYN